MVIGEFEGDYGHLTTVSIAQIRAGQPINVPIRITIMDELGEMWECEFWPPGTREEADDEEAT